MKDEIEHYLKLFFEKKAKESEKLGKEIFEMNKILEEFTLRGGKRIRSRLMCHSFSCYKKLNKKIIKASIAMELLQSFLLIHDDIMDNDTLRRGKKTVHKIYEEQGKKRYKTDSLGKSLAILVGDLAFSYANEILLSSNLEHANKAALYLNKTTEQVIYGQHLDLINNYRSVSEEDVKKVNQLKTSTYTITAPLAIGAILAGEKDKAFHTKIGHLLGEAFQLQDDILGIYGEQTGKETGSDVREGKKTMLVVKSLPKNKLLQNNLGKKISVTTLKKIRKSITNSGALSHCRYIINENINSAIKLITKKKLRKEGKEHIIQLCTFLRDRKY